MEGDNAALRRRENPTTDSPDLHGSEFPNATSSSEETVAETKREAKRDPQRKDTGNTAHSRSQRNFTRTFTDLLKPDRRVGPGACCLFHL
jgi:hypothetical protein